MLMTVDFSGGAPAYLCSPTSGHARVSVPVQDGDVLFSYNAVHTRPFADARHAGVVWDADAARVGPGVGSPAQQCN